MDATCSHLGCNAVAIDVTPEGHPLCGRHARARARRVLRFAKKQRRLALRFQTMTVPKGRR